MKTIYTTTTQKCKWLLLLILSATTTIASAQNLVTNPGFENGTIGWSTNCSMEIYTEPSYGGSNSSNNVTEIDAERCFNQQVCILPGLTYTFSYKATRRPQSPTPANPGITVKVTGVTTGTSYVNVSQLYTNTTFNPQTKTFTISIPKSSKDTKLNIEFTNYNNTGTYGVVVDDISLAPSDDNALSVNAPAATTINIANSLSVDNAPSGANYNWDFGTGSTPASSTKAKPNNVVWTNTGNMTVTVSLSNSACTMASYSASVVVVNILSVDLLSFTAKLDQQTGLLTWVTENEINNNYFSVERSLDGNHFDSIGRVAGMNNSSAYSYHFSDKQVSNGHNFYRLKQVDVDGKFKYSQTVVINSNVNTDNASMRLYPNPAATVINYTITVNKNSTVTMQIFNTAGLMVKSQSQELTAGTNQHAVSISDLQKGAYFLKIIDHNGGKISAQEFIKAL